MQVIIVKKVSFYFLGRKVPLLNEKKEFSFQEGSKSKKSLKASWKKSIPRLSSQKIHNYFVYYQCTNKQPVLFQDKP